MTRRAGVVTTLRLMLSGASAAMLAACGPTHDPATAPAPYVGSSWHLLSVSQGSESHTLPRSILAAADFFADGRLVLHDSTNTLSGRYVIAAAGFSSRDMSTSLIGYAGNNATKTMTMNAIDAIAGGGLGTPPPVGARTSGSTLVLDVDGYVMTFERSGPVREPSTSPSTMPTSP